MTIEFRAEIKGGRIEIPARYKKRLATAKKVRVVISDAPKAKSGIFARLLKNPLYIEDFKPLTRDEIYGR